MPEEYNVKNHTDVLIFHTAICAGASQIALMAIEKPSSRISRRPVAQSASELGLVCLKSNFFIMPSIATSILWSSIQTY